MIRASDREREKPLSAPTEADRVAQAVQDYHAGGHGRANRAKEWLVANYGVNFKDVLRVEFQAFYDRDR